MNLKHGLSNGFVEAVAKQMCPSTFVGVYPCDLFGMPTTQAVLKTRLSRGLESTMIINLDPAKDPGSHFVAIAIRPRNPRGVGVSATQASMLYFDSLGLGPHIQPLLIDILEEHWLQPDHAVLINLTEETLLQTATSLFCGIFTLAFIMSREQGELSATFLGRHFTNLLTQVPPPPSRAASEAGRQNEIHAVNYVLRAIRRQTTTT